MRYRDLAIQTQREAPNNARTQGAAWLVRAGYLSREGEVLPLGEKALQQINRLCEDGVREGLDSLGLPLLTGAEETFFVTPDGRLEVLHCPACGAAARAELAPFRKAAMPAEDPLPMEMVATPECPTIEALAAFLGIPESRTAKALMFTRPSDGMFVFVVVRGDMTLSEAKLRRALGEVRLATTTEIEAAGAVPGYASPVGLTRALIAVDDLIPASSNLAAGANEAGFHLLNTNSGRDYTPALVTDLALAGAGSPCAVCGASLVSARGEMLAEAGRVDARAVLLALADTHHDEKGLCLPASAAPFDLYVMHVAGKELDTRSAVEEVAAELEAAGLSVLLDDRDERAGVKFNDADLIGLPLRLTVGERALKEGRVELKPRTGENITAPRARVVSAAREMLGGMQ